MERNQSDRVSRRTFLRNSVAVAFAAGAGPAVIVPGRAQQKTLRILKWKFFVPEYETWFTDVFAKEWGERNATQVVVDSVGLGDLSGMAAAEAQAKSGHDLVVLLRVAPELESSVINHREIHEECVHRFGAPLDLAYKSNFNPATSGYHGLCAGYVPSLLNYRRDLWEGIGVAPDSWDAVLRGGRQLKLLYERPVGISLAPEHNSEHTLRAIMNSFGSFVQDETGNPSLNSKQTLEALKFVKSLYQDAMPKDVVNWNAVSNNRYMLSDEGCLTIDTLSIVRAAESKTMPVGDRLGLRPLPGGPEDRPGLGPAFGVDNFIVWKFADNVEGASRFLVDYVAQSRTAFVTSGFQHMPCFPNTVPDLGKLVDGDRGGAVPDQYGLLAGVNNWVTNMGYPGFASAAIGDVLGSHVISSMFSQAATGTLTPEEALAQADLQVQDLFQKRQQ